LTLRAGVQYKDVVIKHALALFGCGLLAAQAATIPEFHYDVRAEGWLSPGGGFDMPAALRRFATDRRTLERYYTSRLSRERAKALGQFAEAWVAVLNQAPFEGLDVDGRVDWLLLRARLKEDQQRLAEARAREAEIAPLIPFADTILEMDDALRRMEFANASEAAARVDRVAVDIHRLTEEINGGRLKATATAGRRAAHTVETLRQTLKRWHDFYDGYDPMFTWWVGEPWKRADAALEGYATLLGEKIAGVRASDKDTIIGDPVGREALENALAAEWVPYTPEELIAHAQSELAWCQAEMIRNARQLGYGDDWHKALEHVKDDYVKPGEQPALVRDLEYQAIDFLRQHNLITIPEPALNLWRMEMMSPERQRINPFFTGGELLSVSYPTAAMTEEQKLMSMRGNNIHFSRATVFHEMIPGHFLQAYMMQRYRPWRMVFDTPFWEEGWAFYWEMLLWDEGFPRSPEDRIGMLFWRMHRAARVIFSLSFHLGRMSAMEAVNFLVTQVGHERENAAAEVRRSFETDEYGPLYQCAYEIGALQFRALHAELVDSGKMTNTQFHDAVLKLGIMPVEMVRASLRGEKLPKDFTARWKFYDELPPGR
jgi:Bacterial protein of unknown function (DUF885)